MVNLLPGGWVHTHAFHFPTYCFMFPHPPAAARPQDVYISVADSVRARIHADAQLGHESAVFLDGHITRKVCIYVWVWMCECV